MFDRDDAKRFGILIVLIVFFISSCVTIVKVIDSDNTNVEITKGAGDSRLETQPLIHINKDTIK